jgi:hypothetical protein
MEALWKQAELRIARSPVVDGDDLVHAERTAISTRHARTEPRPYLSFTQAGRTARLRYREGWQLAAAPPPSMPAVTAATRARTPLIVGGELLTLSWTSRCPWIGDVLWAEDPVAAEAPDELERASVV